MPAAGQLRNGSPPTSTTPPNNLAPHDSLFLGSAGRWLVAFGSFAECTHRSAQLRPEHFTGVRGKLPRTAGQRPALPRKTRRSSEKNSFMSDSGCPTACDMLPASL